MGMSRLFSFFDSRGCDKVVNGVREQKMAHATRPVVEIPSIGASKRKRNSESELAIPIHDAKRRNCSIPLENGPPVSENVAVERVIEKNEPVFDLERVQESIESQLSLEILLKHKELRLIDQELAKSQTALEQLRRCHLIPYPVMQGDYESMLNVSNGTGPTVAQGGNVPQWASPYGVTDGPYTRHYAKWLIPASPFDGVQVDWQRGFDASHAGKTVPEGRATRNSFIDTSTPASKSRSQRGSTCQKLQALSSGYPQVKEKTGPCTLTRGDGQLVKLVCIDCNRENFSSTQGFINHCRIAHRRDFKSHEDAAIACGQPIDRDEIGLVGEDNQVNGLNGLVHPLVRSAPTDAAAYLALMSRIKTSMALYEEGKLPGDPSVLSSAYATTPKSRTPKPAAAPSKTFTPSPATPHLSNLMRDSGYGGDFDELVNEARTQIDFDDYDSDDEASEDIEMSGVAQHTETPIVPGMRVPSHAGTSSGPFGRPGSSKGIDARRQHGLSVISPRLSHATPAINTAATGHRTLGSTRLVNVQHHDHVEDHHDEMDVDMLGGPSINDLSPHTVASNNAPSLVSDDGGDDEGDDVESTAASDVEGEDSDVAEIDIEDDSGDKVAPRTILRNRSGSASERLRKEKNQVTFVSPVKAKENKRNRRT